METDETRYFEARWLAIQGRYHEAEGLLRPILVADHSATFSYQLTNGWWEVPVSLMARIELGKVYDLQGKRDEALAEYQEALKLLDQSAPPIPEDEAFKSIDEWITDAWLAFFKIFSYQSAREILQTLIREPFLLGRKDQPQSNE